MSDALKCPMCGCAELVSEFRSPAGYDIVRCRECRLVFTDARMAPDPLPPGPEHTDTVAQRSAKKALWVFTAQRAKLVESAKSSGRLLDVGADGTFAKFMTGRGFDAVQAKFDELNASLGKFDVITLWHVAENLERPVEFLSALRTSLAPGGVLVISVPNFASWQSELFKARWFHLDAPRHLIHFEPSTLEQCLRRSGFTVAQEVPFLPEYGASGWIQSALNRLLPHQNFLHEWVKEPEAIAQMPMGLRAVHFAASVAGSMPLLAAALPIELLAAQSNRAGAITVVAQPT